MIRGLQAKAIAQLVELDSAKMAMADGPIQPPACGLIDAPWPMVVGGGPQHGVAEAILAQALYRGSQEHPSDAATPDRGGGVEGVELPDLPVGIIISRGTGDGKGDNRAMLLGYQHPGPGGRMREGAAPSFQERQLADQLRRQDVRPGRDAGVPLGARHGCQVFRSRGAQRDWARVLHPVIMPGATPSPLAPAC